MKHLQLSKVLLLVADEVSSGATLKGRFKKADVAQG